MNSPRSASWVRSMARPLDPESRSTTLRLVRGRSFHTCLRSPPKSPRSRNLPTSTTTDGRCYLEFPRSWAPVEDPSGRRIWAIYRGDIRIPFQSKRHAQRLLGEIQGAIEKSDLSPGEVLAAYLPPFPPRHAGKLPPIKNNSPRVGPLESHDESGGCRFPGTTASICCRKSASVRLGPP